MDKSTSTSNEGFFFFEDGKVTGRSDPQYLDKLEKAFVSLIKGATAIEQQNNHYRGLIDRLLGDLKAIQKVLIAVSIVTEKVEEHGWLTKENRATIVKAQKIIHRFTGKKVSKERKAIYDEIKETMKALRSQGAQGAYTEVVRIVAKKHKKQPEKLYKSFVKYKNRLYVKSPKRRQS